MSPRRIARVELALRRIVPSPSWRRQVGRAELAAPNWRRLVVPFRTGAPRIHVIIEVVFLRILLSPGLAHFTALCYR